MNETLRRRLLGLFLILVALFALSLVMPQPGELPPSDQNIQRITLDLQTSAASSEVPPPIVTPVPPVIEATKPAMTEVPQHVVGDEPDIDVPSLSEASGPVAARGEALVAESSKAQQKPLPKTGIVAQTQSKPLSVQPKTAVAVSQKWYVQLGAFSDVSNARQLLQKFRAQKYAGILSPVDTTKGPRYRVRIGPYMTREQAADAQKKIIKAGASGTTLVEG